MQLVSGTSDTYENSKGHSVLSKDVLSGPIFLWVCHSLRKQSCFFALGQKRREILIHVSAYKKKTWLKYSYIYKNLSWSTGADHRWSQYSALQKKGAQVTKNVEILLRSWVHLRNRKYLRCLYGVIETRGKVWYRLVCHVFVLTTFWHHLWSITEQKYGNRWSPFVE